jgi:hypothetical protein
MGAAFVTELCSVVLLRLLRDRNGWPVFRKHVITAKRLLWIATSLTRTRLLPSNHNRAVLFITNLPLRPLGIGACKIQILVLFPTLVYSMCPTELELDLESTFHDVE